MVAFVVAFIVGLHFLPPDSQESEQETVNEGGLVTGESLVLGLYRRLRGIGRAAQSRGPGQEEAGDLEPSPAGAKLRELKQLLDDGVITESEFEAKKTELLREL